MRFPGFLLAVCAAGVCAGFVSVRADDTPVQAAARAALEQKLHEMDASSSQTNPAPVVPQPETPPVQPAPSAVIAPAPSAAAVSTPPTALDTEAQEKAQATLEEKMRELDMQTERQQQGAPILVNASGSVIVETPPSQPAPEMPASAGGSGLFEPATLMSSDTESQIVAREALKQKM